MASNLKEIKSRGKKGSALTHDEMDYNLGSLVHKVTTSSNGTYATFSYAPVTASGGANYQASQSVVRLFPPASYYQNSFISKSGGTVEGDLTVEGGIGVLGRSNFSGQVIFENDVEMSNVLVGGKLQVEDNDFETVHIKDNSEGSLELTGLATPINNADAANKGYVDTSVPSLQDTTAVVKDALTNINGRQLTNYTATHSTVTVGSVSYEVYKINYSGSSTITEDQARTYMECMVGSRFLPTYNYEKPQNTLFIFADTSVWKPQFSLSGDLQGLYLFKVTTLDKSEDILCKKLHFLGDIYEANLFKPGATFTVTVGDENGVDRDTLKTLINERAFGCSTANFVDELYDVVQNGRYSWYEMPLIKLYKSDDQGSSVEIATLRYEYPDYMRFDVPENPTFGWEAGNELDIVAECDWDSEYVGPLLSDYRAYAPLNISQVHELSETLNRKANKTELSFLKATNKGAILSGSNSKASGQFAVAAGYHVTASGYASHAEGDTAVASGDYSHAEGWYTTASGEASHAEGCHTLAKETYDHAEGHGTQAIGGASHAEGTGTVASANDSHAEGYSTVASANNSHAEGSGSVASGFAAHAEGNSVASQPLSHTEGHKTIVKNTAEHAEGSYNESHTSLQGGGKTLHSIGIGNENQRRNAFEVMMNGDAYFYGLGGYDGTNPCSASVSTLQDWLKPVIVSGSWDSENNTFTPASGTVSAEEAIAAFEAGRSVVFSAVDTVETLQHYRVIASYLDDAQYALQKTLYAFMPQGHAMTVSYYYPDADD